MLVDLNVMFDRTAAVCRLFGRNSHSVLASWKGQRLHEQFGVTEKEMQARIASQTMRWWESFEPTAHGSVLVESSMETSYIIYVPGMTALAVAGWTRLASKLPKGHKLTVTGTSWYLDRTRTLVASDRDLCGVWDPRFLHEFPTAERDRDALLRVLQNPERCLDMFDGPSDP